MDLILQSQFYFLTSIAILSLMIGSFLNVVIWRLPKMLHQTYREQCYTYLNETESLPLPEQKKIHFNLSFPNSHCPNCQTPIKVYDNIPILSFLILKGRCRHCHQTISWRYPFIELLTVVLSVATAFILGPNIKTIFALPFTWSILVLSAIDIEHQILPDDIVLPLLWLGLAINIFSIFSPLTDAVIGAIMGYLFLWSIYWLFKLITGKEGMGYGDFKLLATFGAWCGWQTLPSIVLISATIGALFGIIAIALKKINRSNPIPFGPFLAFGGWIALIFHDKVMQWFGLLV